MNLVFVLYSRPWKSFFANLLLTVCDGVQHEHTIICQSLNNSLVFYIYGFLFFLFANWFEVCWAWLVK